MAEKPDGEGWTEIRVYVHPENGEMTYVLPPELTTGQELELSEEDLGEGVAWGRVKEG